MPCVPCQAKKILNQDSQRAWNRSFQMEKKVTGLVKAGKLSEDEALLVLTPLMEADQAFIELVDKAVAGADHYLEGL